MTRAAVRPATDADLAGIVAIYNEQVTTGTASLDLEPVSIELRRPWFEDHDLEGPHRILVADVGGEVAGWAASGPFRTRPGYRSTVETTVYVHPDHRGKGFGLRLMMELLDAIDHAGVHRAIAAISLPNERSVALHERLGYELVGVMSEVGHKFGDWVDVAWYLRKAP